MLSACAKTVQTMGKACWNFVGVRPQDLRIGSSRYKNSAENSALLPELSDIFAHRNPQANGLILPLLWQWFSPLSTQPITTTTNLKTKKGNN